MSTVFGPVRSRRLGWSLGVDPLPHKTCNWSCVYCQLGRTTRFCTERRSTVEPEHVVEEVAAALARTVEKPDHVTLVSSGEPTLYADLGPLLRGIGNVTNTPLAILTNGSLLGRDDVTEELAAADVVIASLGAGNPSLFTRIHRPAAGLPFDEHVRGLRAFRRRFHGHFGVEVMLVAGLNDSETALHELATTIDGVDPDSVYINTPVRPPAEAWVTPPSQDVVRRAHAILRRGALLGADNAAVDLAGCPSARDAVVEVLRRHPMFENDLVRVLEPWSSEETRDALAELRADGRIRVVDRGGSRFWSSSGSRYGDLWIRGSFARAPENDS